VAAQNTLNPIPGAFRSSRFLSIRADEIEGAHTRARAVLRPRGFINWIMPDETSVRDASGCPRGETPFRATRSFPFRKLLPSSRFILPPTPSLPPSAISLLSRRQDTGIDGNRDPLCPTRGRFLPRIPLTSRIRGIKHFVREIKRDPRRLVNTGTGYSVRPFLR